MQTLRHVVATLEYVKSKGIEVRFHGRGKNEASHYCGQCEVSSSYKHHTQHLMAFWHIEDMLLISCIFSSLKQQLEVFNILFIREQEKRHVVHCMGCARKQSPSLQGFVCLEEYRISELNQVYDQFVLHKHPSPPLPITPTPTAQSQKQPKETAVASQTTRVQSSLTVWLTDLLSNNNKESILYVDILDYSFGKCVFFCGLI